MMLKMFWKHPRSSLYEQSWRGPIEKNWLQHSKSRLFSRRFFSFPFFIALSAFFRPMPSRGSCFSPPISFSSRHVSHFTSILALQELHIKSTLSSNLLILKHCRKSNSKVYMYLIRTACKTSKSYLEVNPFLTHNIPHENKPFIVGGIFDKHVQV